VATPFKEEAVVTEQELRDLQPEIAWDEPVPICLLGYEDNPHYGCRYCIAQHGLKGWQVWQLPTDPEIMRRHIIEDHGRSMEKQLAELL
jgi:hypothetical protein